MCDLVVHHFKQIITNEYSKYFYRNIFKKTLTVMIFQYLSRIWTRSNIISKTTSSVVGNAGLRRKPMKPWLQGGRIQEGGSAWVEGKLW